MWPIFEQLKCMLDKENSDDESLLEKSLRSIAFTELSEKFALTKYHKIAAVLNPKTKQLTRLAKTTNEKESVYGLLREMMSKVTRKE